eukprot:4859399-Amphidinium_carterae.1
MLGFGIGLKLSEICTRFGVVPLRVLQTCRSAETAASQVGSRGDFGENFGHSRVLTPSEASVICQTCKSIAQDIKLSFTGAVGRVQVFEIFW